MSVSAYVMRLLFLAFVMFLSVMPVSVYALTVSRESADNNEFLFVANDTDDGYFVTPTKTLNPRMTGSNHWTSQKAGLTGVHLQESLGYIDDGHNHSLTENGKTHFDMWLESSPIAHPLYGLGCLNWHSNCNLDTGMMPPQTTDAKGFYGAIVPSGNATYMHGLMGESFYHYLYQMAVGSSLTMDINTCTTQIAYDATSGQRCHEQSSGTWRSRVITQTKVAQLHIENSNALTEVFINSDGVPVLENQNGFCRIGSVGSASGIICEMVNYTLQHTGISNTGIRLSSSVNNSALASAIKAADVQISINGSSSWKTTSSYLNFNDLKAGNRIYFFLSSNFFKQMVSLGIADSMTRGLFNIRMSNTLAPQSGFYELSTSNQIQIKPREFSVSIISDDYDSNPHREGMVGPEASSLDFGYVIKTSGKTSADRVRLRVKGPSVVLQGQTYCEFSSPDKRVHVPFPARLTVTMVDGSRQNYDAGCNEVWYDITQALWSHSPWQDISGDTGTLDSTRIMFSVLMNQPVSLRQSDGQTSWGGEVSASGEVQVEATWFDIGKTR